jgi:hypothetical protein
MRSFAEAWPEPEILQQLIAKIAMGPPDAASDKGASPEGIVFCGLFASEQWSSETNIEQSFLPVLIRPYFPLFNGL